jgi:polyhydroxyalkanoate synthesis repressor PhaR
MMILLLPEPLARRAARSKRPFVAAPQQACYESLEGCDMPEAAKTAAETPPVIIKKYANRRLYDTESSSYITLDHLSTMTRQGREFKVIDAKTGDDITHSVLTQIVVEEEKGGTLLPVSFLRDIIGLYGGQMQSMVPDYLEASMLAFRRNQEQLRGMMGVANPFETIAKQNMAMLKAATNLWAAPKPPEPAAAASDLEQLKAQVAALQAQLERMSK